MAGDDDRVSYLMGDGDDKAVDPVDAEDLDGLRLLLADPSLWEDPPTDLSETIVAAISAETPTTSTTSPAPHGVATPTTSSRRRSLAWLAPALLGAAAALLIAFAFTRANDDEGTSQAVDGTVTLQGTELLPDVSGHADVFKERSGVWIQFDVPGLPRREGNEFYQAWLRNEDGTGLVPIGTFHEGDRVSLWAGVSMDDFPILTVTRETVAGPKDPLQASSGEVVVRGQYVEP